MPEKWTGGKLIDALSEYDRRAEVVVPHELSDGWAVDYLEVREPDRYTPQAHVAIRLVSAY